MGRKRYKAEEIIGKLRQAEVFLSQGSTMGETNKKITATDQTCYRSRKEHGEIWIEQTKRLKQLEKENSRLRKTSVASILQP